MVFSDGSNVSTNSTLCEVVRRVRVLSVGITVSECSIKSLLNAQNLTIIVMAPANFIVGHMKNAFNANSVNKTYSVLLQHCADHRIQYNVCVSAVLHQH
jgi:hypothetical protein